MGTGHDKTGRTKLRSNKIDGQFAARLIEMLESPAMAALSLSGRRFLDRLEIELANHGGKENGKLPVTYDDSVAFGMDRHAIAAAIRETCALGFVEITVKGRAGNAEYRAPSLYRLTYKPTDRAEPTHEWRKIKTVVEAKRVAQEARNASPAKQNPSGGKRRASVGETHTENAECPMGETHTTASVGKPTLLSILGAGGQGERVADEEPVS